MFKKLVIASAVSAVMVGVTACNSQTEVAAPAASSGIDPQLFTDALFAVMNADRANYTKLVVARLGPTGSGVIKPDEHWQEYDNGTLLPAQMFRAGAEAVAEVTDEFSYSLQSLWPIGKQNGPKTPLEEEGLQFVVDNPGENFYGKETLGDVTYYTGVYADVAVSEACTVCHNEHKDSPKTDFKVGEVMGGVVIRVPI